MRDILLGDGLRYFIDTEFYEDGKTIDLISLAVVCSDGRELYMCNQEAALHLVSPWVRENVLPSLPSYGSDTWTTRLGMAEKLRWFVQDGKVGPEFWAYFADYDWVAICQLFGTMIELPEPWPKYCLDLKQLMYLYGVSTKELPKQDEKTEHNALGDARWVRDAFSATRRLIEGGA